MKNIKNQSVVSANQFDRQLIDTVIQTAEKLDPKQTINTLNGKVMASLF